MSDGEVLVIGAMGLLLAFRGIKAVAIAVAALAVMVLLVRLTA